MSELRDDDRLSGMLLNAAGFGLFGGVLGALQCCCFPLSVGAAILGGQRARRRGLVDPKSSLGYSFAVGAVMSIVMASLGTVIAMVGFGEEEMELLVQQGVPVGGDQLLMLTAAVAFVLLLGTGFVSGFVGALIGVNTGKDKGEPLGPRSHAGEAMAALHAASTTGTQGMEEAATVPMGIPEHDEGSSVEALVASNDVPTAPGMETLDGNRGAPASGDLPASGEVLGGDPESWPTAVSEGRSNHQGDGSVEPVAVSEDPARDEDQSVEEDENEDEENL